MLKPLQELSPRRKKQGAALGGAIVLYSLLGYLALPSLVRTLAVDYARNTLHLELSLSEVRVDPWRMALRLDDLRVGEPGVRQPLVAVRSLYLNLDLLASLWQQRLEVDEFDLLQPDIRATLDAKGDLNLLKLMPPEDPDSAEVPWQLAHLSVRQGRVVFRDESRPLPFETTLAPLSLQLYNLSSRADSEGNYHFAAETGQGEGLAWKGKVGVNPVRSEGRFSLTGWQARTVADYAQDALPVAVKAGVMDLHADYQLIMDSETPRLRMSAGKLDLRGLRAETLSSQPLMLAVDRLSLQKFGLNWPEQSLAVPDLVMQGLALSDGGRVVATIDAFSLVGADWSPAADRARIGQTVLSGVRLLDNTQPILELPTLEVRDMALAPDRQHLATGSIRLDRGQTRVVRLTASDTNWQRYLDVVLQRMAAAAPVTVTSPGTAKPWQLALGELQVQDFHIQAEDRTPRRPVTLPLYIRTLTVHPELDLKKPHRFEGELSLGKSASLAMSGLLDEQPFRLDSQLKLNAFELPWVAPYLADMTRFRLDRGRLSLDGRLRVADGKTLQADYQGGLGVQGFSADDVFLQEKFLAWKNLTLLGMDFRLAPLKIGVREMVVDEPFTRVMILPDKTLNISQILADRAAKPAAPSSAKPETAVSATVLPLEIGRINVRNGAMLFADLSLTPQFATGMESLSGDIRHVSTRPGAVAEIGLSGRVDQYGKVDIRGRFSPLAPDVKTDVALKFDNLELTTLTPYSAKFAGYRIDKGKLSLDLRYQIEDRRLKAENKVVLNQLTLGEKVDSPDAVSMPLRLALALLKDSKGVIDIDLPVSGSLDDPQFRIGPIVWKAFVNVVTKVATAPFRFIAGLSGGGEDMDSLAFRPGSAETAQSERDKLKRLADALRQRPALKAELRGVYDPVADREAVQARRVADALLAKSAQAGGERKALEQLYIEKLGAEAYRQAMTLALRPSGGQSLAIADEALQASLRAALIAAETVEEGDLRQLAMSRSRALRQLLIEEGGVEDSRVFVLEPESGTAVEGVVVSRVGLEAL